MDMRGDTRIDTRVRYEGGYVKCACGGVKGSEDDKVVYNFSLDFRSCEGDEKNMKE